MHANENYLFKMLTVFHYYCAKLVIKYLIIEISTLTKELSTL